MFMQTEKCERQARGHRTGSRRTSRRCGIKRSAWPPISPDCNHLDNFVLGVSELMVKAKPHNKTEDLIMKIKEVMGSLDRDTVAKAYKSYTARIDDVVTADAYFIE
jgi:hypothetical protein